MKVYAVSGTHGSHIVGVFRNINDANAAARSARTDSEYRGDNEQFIVTEHTLR